MPCPDTPLAASSECDCAEGDRDMIEGDSAEDGSFEVDLCFFLCAFEMGAEGGGAPGTTR